MPIVSKSQGVCSGGEKIRRSLALAGLTSEGFIHEVTSHNMALSNNGLVHLPLKEKIAGSNPRGVTIRKCFLPQV